MHRAVRLLVGRIGPRGEADLVADFSRPLMALVFNDLFGMPVSAGDRLDATLGRMMEGGAGAAEGEAEYARYVLELIAAKAERRGDDLPSRLLDHPAGLTPEEVTWQVFLTLGAGYEPTANLVSNTLSRILGNPVYYSTLTSGARPVMDAVVEVLHHETPLTNYGIYYAREPVACHGVWLRDAVPVVVSFRRAHVLRGAGGHRRAAPGGRLPPVLGRGPARLSRQAAHAAHRHRGDRAAHPVAARPGPGAAARTPRLAARSVPPVADRPARPLHPPLPRPPWS